MQLSHMHTTHTHTPHTTHTHMCVHLQTLIMLGSVCSLLPFLAQCCPTALYSAEGRSHCSIELYNIYTVWCSVCMCTCMRMCVHSLLLPLPPAVAPANTLVSDPVVVHQINHTLSCSFDGLPRPNVTWRFNGSTFVTGSDNYVIRESDNMSHVDIVGTELGNSGEYECEVSNLLGTDSDTVFLTVQGEGGSPGAHRGGVLHNVGRLFGELCWWDLSNATSAKHKLELVSLVAGTEMPLPPPLPLPPSSSLCPH